MKSYSVKIQPLEPEKISFNSNIGTPLCAFTVDVEDWYQSCIDYDAPITERVVRNTERVLAMLDRYGVKATFFVQGRVAETFPQLLQCIDANGHEIQSHGYSHRPLFLLNRQSLRNELDRARKTVEDACGVQVSAFRAPDFSILKDNLWALEILAEVGFKVDSSIFPMRAQHYGIAGWEVSPHYLTLENGAKILEIPVAIWTRGKIRFPIAGGGYFRLIPYILLHRALQNIVTARRPAVVYCHPYEFNAHEMDDYRNAVNPVFRFSQSIGRGHFETRVIRLLTQISCGRLDQVLAAWGLV